VAHGVAARDGAYTTLGSGDLQQPLPIENDSVDVVVCVGVMTYVPDVEATWREFARVVRPGGLIVVTQREDLWDPRDCQGVIDRMSGDGIWGDVDVSEPAPYLPGNTDGMAPLGVYYLAARVREGSV
jgi:SAM-dependent methyltransferase